MSGPTVCWPRTGKSTCSDRQGLYPGGGLLRQEFRQGQLLILDLMADTHPHPLERVFTPANRRQLLRHLLDLEAQCLEDAVTDDPEPTTEMPPDAPIVASHPSDAGRRHDAKGPTHPVAGQGRRPC